MATPVSDLRGMLQREINVPGFEQLPDISNSELDGYIKDAFWHARLRGMLKEYTINGDNIEDSSGGDLPEYLQMLVVLTAGFRMVRLKALSLAVNLRAKAGGVEYEQQASATVLREILQSLERELAQLAALYSEELGSTIHYFDGVLQSEYAVLNDLAAFTVL